jgi:membrane protease subunit (stomatin/prohibitin family)
MGVFDFVQNGVREMMIARHDQYKQYIVFKHPNQNIPMYSQITVDSDECAVFFRDGRVYGVLPPGRHTLHTQNIPFLNQIVQKFTGGDVLIAEVFFVKTAPIRNVPFGGSCGEVEDPFTGLQVPLRIFGEFSVVVTDPVRFIVGYHGQAQGGDNEATLKWIKDKFTTSVGTVVTELAQAADGNLLPVLNNREKLAQAFIARAPNLNDIGVRILDISRCEPNVPEEFMQEIRAKRKELSDAQWEVKKKKIAIEGAAADAQARQFELDQKFQQDSRYVKDLAGNYQNYAAGQAMIGAGQGMAQYGVGEGGVAGAGMQMAVGVNMAQQMGGAFQQGQQFNAQQPAAPGAPPQAPAPGAPPQFSPGGVMVTCTACNTRQPGGKFCAECGTALAQPKKFCTGCGTELGATAKFCANCGTAAGAAVSKQG